MAKSGRLLPVNCHIFVLCQTEIKCNHWWWSERQCGAVRVAWPHASRMKAVLQMAETGSRESYRLKIILSWQWPVCLIASIVVCRDRLPNVAKLHEFAVAFQSLLAQERQSGIGQRRIAGEKVSSNVARQFEQFCVRGEVGYLERR